MGSPASGVIEAFCLGWTVASESPCAGWPLSAPALEQRRSQGARQTPPGNEASRGRGLACFGFSVAVLLATRRRSGERNPISRRLKLPRSSQAGAGARPEVCGEDGWPTPSSSLDCGRRELAVVAAAVVGSSAPPGALAEVASVAAQSSAVAESSWREFPAGFAWGSATAAFQIEGGASEGGKGPSIWDTFSHVPGNIVEGQTADIACDHLHRFREDVALLRDVGAKAYRFSISWARVLPNGTLAGGVNEAGLKFYDDLFLELQAKGIEPAVTLYHWDLPQALEDQGGWLEPSVVDAFREYAQLCFDRFGRYVRTWCTINEPWTQCVVGFVFGSHAPGRSVAPGVEPYLAGHHMLLAHAAAVKVFRATKPPGSRIAMVLNTEWHEPQEPGNPADVAAAERARAFNLGWFADPIYKGDYPAIMRERCGDRLPTFTEEQRRDLLGSNDYFAINSYSARYVCEDTPLRNFLNTPATLKILPFISDVAITKLKAGFAAASEKAEAARAEPQNTALAAGAATSRPRGGPAMPVGVPATSYVTDSQYLTAVPLDVELTAMGWPVAHYGLGRLLLYIQKTYNSPGGIFVTEAGAAFVEEASDPSGMRQRRYLENQAVVVRRAIAEGADVRGYIWWTLMDNFEWSSGYTKKFGLFEVDFSSQMLERRPRPVARAFQELSSRNALSDKVSYSEFLSCLQRPDKL